MTAVKADNICKSFPINARSFTRLRDALGTLQSLKRFTAVQDVSFELDEGDTLGIMGVNGAGKSTLLKIVAGVMVPTSGKIEVNGRVGALLELGASFNGEYTGLENAKMSLRLAGFNEKQIAQELDNVLGFADIGEFINAPVKTYSSGMFVRLAFACATAARPQILLVDEALSVGDLFFQAKCVERMKRMLSDGTSLLFVSHDIGAVKSICRRCLLLDGGKQIMLDESDKVARRYFQLKVEHEQYANVAFAQELAPSPQKKRKIDCTDTLTGHERLGNGRTRFLRVALLNEEGMQIENADFGQRVTLHQTLELHEDIEELCVGYHIQSAAGVDVVYSDTAIEECNLKGLKAGRIVEVAWSFKLNLGEGSHNIVAVCSVPIDMASGQVEFCDYVHTAAQFCMARREKAKIYSLSYWDNEVKII